MNVVIMAGGTGTRFWPMSRASRPKQLLPILGDTPMVVATYQRIQALVPDERIAVVIGSEHEAEIRRLFAGTGVHILVEPQGRNTAPCVGLAAAFMDHLGHGEPTAILPSDHYIGDPAAFRRGLCEAEYIATRGGIATLGIVPTRPETGYGYIEPDINEEVGADAWRVKKFVEKPDLETARNYLLTGSTYWNAGVFVATPKTLLAEFASHMPGFHKGLENLATTFGTDRFHSSLKHLYEATENASFDTAILEQTATPIYVISCDCGWSDVGSWNSLFKVMKQNGETQESKAQDGSIQDGQALMLDCKDTFVVSKGKRYVTALGLRRLLVVDTEDALLVADLDRSQDVKELVSFLKKADLQQLL